MTCTDPLVSARTWAFSVGMAPAASGSFSSTGATVRRWLLTERNRTTTRTALNVGSSGDAARPLRTVIGKVAARPVVSTLRGHHDRDVVAAAPRPVPGRRPRCRRGTLCVTSRHWLLAARGRVDALLQLGAVGIDQEVGVGGEGVTQPAYLVQLVGCELGILRLGAVPVLLVPRGRRAGEQAGERRRLDPRHPVGPQHARGLGGGGDQADLGRRVAPGTGGQPGVGESSAAGSSPRSGEGSGPGRR